MPTHSSGAPTGPGRAGHALVAVLVGCLTVTSCWGGGDDGPDPADRVALDTRGEARTPAAAVRGAQPGGTIHVLGQQDFGRLDPAGIYTAGALTASAQLLLRALTGYVEDPETGALRLVGDLATNTGHSPDGGRSWRYTLRRGVTYQDGRPITAQDVAYGVARAFGPVGAEGPQYLQNWLQPQRTYRGPADGEPPGISTPDARTIVFSLAEPRADFPLAAALPTTTPVPAGARFDAGSMASGPYRVEPGSYRPGQRLRLIRNAGWDPRTDPIRHQYPDAFDFAFDLAPAAQTERLLADQGEDQTAVQTAPVPVELVQQARRVARPRDRLLQASTPYVRYLAINTQKVPDVRVRRALGLALDRDAWAAAAGGSAAGAVTTSLLSPTLPGYRHGGQAAGRGGGDPAAARALLSGRTAPTLNYCFSNTPAAQRTAAAAKASLRRAGFAVALQPIGRDAFYPEVGRRNTTCHLTVASWSADYPDAGSVLGPLFDGRALRDSGNRNFAYLSDPAVTSRIEALAAQRDRAGAAAGYAELDRDLVERRAVAVPLLTDRYHGLVGSRIGGASISRLRGQPSFAELFVRR